MNTKSRMRVEQHTKPEINWRIDREIERRVAAYEEAGIEAINRRLGRLDMEWDMERVLEAHAGIVTLAGFASGKLINRKFYALPLLIAGFLLRHAVQGRHPLLPILRRLGFRTAREIEKERMALQSLTRAR